MLERLPLYMLSRFFNLPPSLTFHTPAPSLNSLPQPLFSIPLLPLPINYTLGLTYDCNSRCKTCRGYERKEEEMGLEKWIRVFEDLGRSPYWITLTGGEPFLYNDLVRFYNSLCAICHPKMVNIPTNGLMTERIVERTQRCASFNPKTHLTINISIDHSDPAKNDEIRGVPGAYSKALLTLKQLQQLRLRNLSVGIHSVISAYNAVDFPLVAHQLSQLVEPGLYIAEIAESRVELLNTDLPIAPTPRQYALATHFLPQSSSLKGKLRTQYYKHQPLSCYAGYASCQIAPNGEVWFCCIKAESVGNVRDWGFREIWRGERARELRKKVKGCEGIEGRGGRCTLANAAYTNMLMSPRMMMKVIM